MRDLSIQCSVDTKVSGDSSPLPVELVQGHKLSLKLRLVLPSSVHFPVPVTARLSLVHAKTLTEVLTHAGTEKGLYRERRKNGKHENLETMEVVQELSAGPYMHNTAVIILDNLKLRVTSGCKKKQGDVMYQFLVTFSFGNPAVPGTWAQIRSPPFTVRAKMEPSANLAKKRARPPDVPMMLGMPDSFATLDLCRISSGPCSAGPAGPQVKREDEETDREMRANAWLLQHMEAELQKLQNLNRELTTQTQHLTVANNSLLHEREQLVAENQGLRQLLEQKERPSPQTPEPNSPVRVPPATEDATVKATTPPVPEKGTKAHAFAMPTLEKEEQTECCRMMSEDYFLGTPAATVDVICAPEYTRDWSLGKMSCVSDLIVPEIRVPDFMGIDMIQPSKEDTFDLMSCGQLL